MPSIIEEKLWAGSEADYQAAIKAEERQDARMAAGYQPDDDEDAPSRLLEVRDGIGYITIHGTLRNSADADMNEWLGITGYPEIRDAMVEAAQNPDIKHIVLDINSGGGSVSGVDDTGKLIRLINDKLKPVTAFTDSNMFSAAYWLGASAGSVYASKSAGIGSIGVIAVHTEQSQYLKNEGINATVVRAGKYKALANSYEPLSEEGKAQIQASVDATYEIFTDHVAQMRGRTKDYTDTVMAQGQEFYGQAAQDRGLVDEILTFDTLISRISTKLMDKSNSFMDNRGKQAMSLHVEVTGDANMAKKTLSESDIAALAAGATLEADASSGATELEVDAEKPTDPPAALDDKPAKAGVETPKPEATKDDSMFQFVSAQLNTANADLLSTKLALAKLEDKNSEMAAAIGPLKDIAVRAINNMRVALGGSAINLDSASVSQVLADYTSVSESFTKRMPVGGVAAVSTADSLGGKKSASPQYMARVNAARHSK